MRQQTQTGFEKYAKTTRRAQFRAEMDRVVPWAELCAFGGIDLGREAAPDETTVCKFCPLFGWPHRHSLEPPRGGIGLDWRRPRFARP